jgi:hypothetical protein
MPSDKDGIIRESMEGKISDGPLAGQVITTGAKLDGMIGATRMFIMLQ